MRGELSRFRQYWLAVFIICLLDITHREAGVLTVGATCVPDLGCQTLAYYRVQAGDNLQVLNGRFQITNADVQAYNPNVSDINLILAGTTLYLPFHCDCMNGILLHHFSYVVAEGETLQTIADVNYQRLTTTSDIADVSNLAANQHIQALQTITIPVRCFCGDPSVDPKYGLFSTYVVQANDHLASLATKFSVDPDVISNFNAGVKNLSVGSIIFIPTRDGNNTFPPFGNSKSSDNGLSRSTIYIIVGSIIGIIVFIVFLFAIIFGCKYYCRWALTMQFDNQESAFLSSTNTSSNMPSRSPSIMLTDLKSVEFSYEELSEATNNFNLSQKIGQGGFASVYYGVIRNQKLAIKMMNIQATKVFLAELQVLSNVHHSNLVQLVGFCTTKNLFLVYEFINNGTLDHHLHRKNFDDKPPLSWTQRVQISLDAARGLEYIHEHINPTYIHGDIKSANILLDNNYHAKVADFGLAKLAEEGIGTRVLGTIGYMPQEYALYGEVSPKLDVYAFGIVLYEIISGRTAISIAQPSENSQSSSIQNREGRTLQSLFEPIVSDPNGITLLPKYIDPALNDEYPIDAVWKMAQLAKWCTQFEANTRPTMRSVVVKLMTLTSSTQEWDVGHFR